MNQYDVKIKRKEGSKATIINEMTILSIKGTTNEIDMLIDFQLHLPSVFYLIYLIFLFYPNKKIFIHSVLWNMV